ncbi:hypothetical protein TNCV_1426531 [Trichonephila clavipes]|nr:hypothetical protein TNCV_1426531 [Trichonephila clavipes]
MEIPLRTAYGQNGRCGMQPKAKHSLRAQAQLMRTETVETVELVKLQETPLPVRLINTGNERRLVQGHETPLRVKGGIEDGQWWLKVVILGSNAQNSIALGELGT